MGKFKYKLAFLVMIILIIVLVQLVFIFYGLLDSNDLNAAILSELQSINSEEIIVEVEY